MNAAEETPSPDDRRMPFLGHLEELRWCLIRSIAFVAVCFCVCLVFVRQLLDLLKSPLTKAGIGLMDAPAQLRTLSVGEAFTALFTIAGVAAVAVGLPYILYEIWKFVSPGLKPSERRAIFPLLFFGTLFFYAGVFFTHKILLPPTLGYFLKLNVDYGLAAEWRMMDYLSFTLTMMLASGVMAELPIVTVVLARFGIVSAPFLLHYWRHAIVVLLVLAAALTPSTDATTMMLLAGPLFALYGISIILAKIFYVQRV